MKVKISSITLKELPNSLDVYIKKRRSDLEQFMISAALSRSPTVRTRWLIDHCDMFLAERILDPFANDKFGIKLADCPVIDLYGIIDDVNEKKIIEFKLRFAE
mgnify:CR=1 FL=1